LGGAGTGWRMTGIDPEGCDLRLGGKVARLDFPARIADAAGARAALVALARRAREPGPATAC
jgi:heme oxygenase (biliverdin-IX-beta and delta-forming)